MYLPLLIQKPVYTKTQKALRFAGGVGVVLLSIAMLCLGVYAFALTNSHEKPWAGTWKSEHVVAVIENNAITVNIKSDDSEALFWKGSFEPGSENTEEGVQVTSVADQAALNKSLLGSQDPTKVFTYENGKLTFKMSMMQVTRQIVLEKVK